jgi:hypothetical protein
MTEETNQPVTEETDGPVSDAARAFEALRAEISLTRHAVEGLTAARERIPDYTPTLGEITADLKALQDALERIEQCPAFALTPAALTMGIVKAAGAARAEDARKLDEAREVLSRSIGRIDGIVDRGQAAEGQKRRLIWGCAGTAVAAVLLWSVLPGAIARTLPASWHVPEWMAARTMGMDMPPAALRLQETASKESSERVR